uniref:Uncharacterized protein n=1 Tax=Xanthomonas phage MK21 TaxID=3148942 RepID=A0AAU7J8I2_9CAUD
MNDIEKRARELLAQVTQMNDIEERARELLAQAHRVDTPKSQKAKCLESGTIHPADVPAIRAIIAALLVSEGCKSS